MLILFDHVDQCVTTRDATALERLASHVRAAKLDRDLARGVSPDASAALALRAQALVRPSTRRSLARSLEQLVEEATRGRIPRPSEARIPIRRDRIRDAADALQLLIDHLLTRAPVPARGVAQVHVLLTDGAGPVYYPGDTDDLRACVLDAVEQLEPLSNWWTDAQPPT